MILPQEAKATTFITDRQNQSEVLKRDLAVGIPKDHLCFFHINQVSVVSLALQSRSNQFPSNQNAGKWGT
jgi:hypothetical protein